MSEERERYEDNKGVVKRRKWKNKQHNGQTKKYKGTNNDRQNLSFNSNYIAQLLINCITPAICFIIVKFKIHEFISVK